MPGYPYNIDPNYGPVSMITEEGKMIKEERIKENPSPNDNTKSQLPVIILTKYSSKLFHYIFL